MTEPEIPRCAAKKTNGEPCTQRPIRGGTVCATHGGRAPAVKAAAAVRLLQAKVGKELAQRSIEPVTDPLARYAELAGEVWAWLELCREQVNRLESWDYTDARLVQDAKAIVQVYERAIERAQKTLLDMLRLGLDAEALRQSRERPTRQQAETLVSVLQGVLDDLDLTAEQRARVPQVIADRVSAVQAAS